VDGDRKQEILGRIYYALMKDLPPQNDDLRGFSEEKGSGPRALVFDLVGSEWIGDASEDEVAEALASQDDDTLSMVAGRVVNRLASRPTCVSV
jgi:hypothetical protein